jgi:hypothetical protein
VFKTCKKPRNPLVVGRTSDIFAPVLRGERRMAHHEEGNTWSKEMDRPEHEATYEAFLNYTKYGIVVCTLILLGLLVFVYN